MIDKKLFLDRNKTLMFGIFEDPDKFLATAGKVHSRGVNIIDCYTPFPVHGIEKAIGLKRSLLPVGAFICGCIGFTCAFAMQYYMMAYDWTNIIGGKPFFAITYMPVLFEWSVLFTAFGIAFLFFARNKMVHGKIPVERVDIRQTDDRLVIAMATDEGGINKTELAKLLADGGAVEVRERTNRGYEDFTDTVVDIKNISNSTQAENH